MKVIIPTTAMDRGGGTRFLHEIGSGLWERGHEVVYAVPKDSPVEYPLRGEVRRLQPWHPDKIPPGDVILTNFYPTVPTVWRGDGMLIRLCLGYEPFFVVDPDKAAQTYRLPIPVAAVSGWLQRILLGQIGRRSVLLNPGIDHRFFHPGRDSRDRLTVLCLGRPGHGYWFKGFSIFVRAMETVMRYRPSTRVIVASTAKEDYQLPFTAQFVVSPSDQELADLYRRTAVFVFPSLFEGFGFPPLEAMACGTPVVTTACGGVSDYARHEENCLMVPPGAHLQMVEAVLRLLDRPALVRRLSAAAAETARAWTWARTLDQLECFLGDALHGCYQL